jgi:hypothetical protein
VRRRKAAAPAVAGTTKEGRDSVFGKNESQASNINSPEIQGGLGLLEFHPLANFFPLLEGEEFEQLVADIKHNGLREKIDTYEGKIVDGRNRYRALQQLGIDPRAEPEKYLRKALYAHTVGGEVAAHEQSNHDRIRAYIISKNAHRRHLTAEQKRDVIASLLKATPEKSNRQIAEKVKASHNTVQAVRSEMESRGQIDHVPVRTDTKGRQQPASRPRLPVMPKPRAKPKNVAAGLNSLSWSQADAESRRQFVEAVGITSLIAAVPPGSDYTILMNVWNRASAEERARFLQFIGAEINDPAAAP